MTLLEFVNRHIGTKVDFDKAFGAQCVDLYRQYTKDVVGIEQTPPVEGAKDIFAKHGGYKQVFDGFRQGDVLIWDATSGNKYGHVAVMLGEFDADNYFVFEQDGFRQDGAHIRVRSKTNLLGGLRA